MALTEHEQAVCDAIAAGRGELVELLRTLIRFDTITHTAGAPPRQEAELQAFLGERLAAAGADVRIWEPEPELIAGHSMTPEGFTFAGRPQLAATFRGTGGGRSLIFNGHIDVVEPGDLDGWEHPPFEGVVDDEFVHGRGSCDMKGGVACMVFAAEMLARLGIRLAGDVIVNTDSEEESTGCGGLAMARTLSADAVIVAEPSALDLWIANRGSLLPTVVIPGRAGHAGMAPVPWQDGGPVNAIEKLPLVLAAVEELRQEWSSRPGHPLLANGGIVPTLVAGGTWIVSYPESCRVQFHIQYLPEQADEDGYGALVEREFEERIRAAGAADPWFDEHPLRVEWNIGGVPPSAVAEDDPIVQTAAAALHDVGAAGRIRGLDNWHDGAMFVVEAGIPAICLGPDHIESAHTVRERVSIDSLVRCAQAHALTAMRFCA
ncbi:MAG: M20 family metallopeptidase [Gaiellales bacterium]